MAKTKKATKANSTIMRAPRAHAKLDHWVGKDQFVADGTSTDPSILWGQPRVGTVRISGDDKKLQKSLPIV
jgi:hypothetical protein